MNLRRPLAVVAVAAAAALRFVVTGAGNIDDAFILLVYVRHFLASGRFYYNVADGSIDGFTSPLDLVVKAAIARALHADAIAVTFWTSLVLHVGVALVGFFAVERLAQKSRVKSPLGLALAAGLALGTAQALADGSAFLLETPLFVLLAMIAALIVLVNPPARVANQVGLGLLLTALVLTRPEGLPLALLLLAAIAWQDRARSLVPALVVAVLVAAYYAWRVRTFGFWAPNTYYAKTSASRLNEVRDGVHYVLAFFASLGAPSLLCLVAVSFFARREVEAPLERTLTGLVLLAWAMVAVVVYAGGDCYGGGRFLALPLSLATLALAVAAIARDGKAALVARRGLWTLVGLQLAIVLGIGVYLVGFYRGPLRVPTREEAFACDRESSRRLAGLLADRPGAIAAQTDFQRLKYFADDLYVLDLTGLNDRAIAHTPVEGPVQWGKLDLLAAAQRRPELIILGHHTDPSARSLADFPLRRVLDEAQLHDDFFGYGVAPVIADALVANYESASVPSCGGSFNFLARRDLLPSLRMRGARVFGQP